MVKTVKPYQPNHPLDRNAPDFLGIGSGVKRKANANPSQVVLEILFFKPDLETTVTALFCSQLQGGALPSPTPWGRLS